MIRDIARNGVVQEECFEELKHPEIEGTALSPEQVTEMHHTRAACAETIRLTCSPIVPHRTTRHLDWR